MGWSGRAGLLASTGRALAALVVLASISGCAGLTPWDGELATEVEWVPLPEGGPRIWVGEVADAREFRPLGRHPWIPTISGGGENDPQRTGPVVGRRLANKHGNRGGNLTLSEGRTAADLAQDALVKGLRLAGYWARAAPEGREVQPIVQAELLELWIRVRQGYFTIRHEGRARVRISGFDPPIAPDGFICGRAIHASGGRSRFAWERVLRMLVEDLAADLAFRLKYPEKGGAAWVCDASVYDDARKKERAPEDR